MKAARNSTEGQLIAMQNNLSTILEGIEQSQAQQKKQQSEQEEQ